MRQPPRQLQPIAAPRTEGSLFTDNVRANLFTDLRAANIGDIVTINIVETASASKDAKTELGRDNKLKAGISTLLGYETEIPINKASIQPSALIGANYTSEFTGEGKTSRKENLKAQISARIIEVLPNGNLVIRGSREITVNYEKQIMIIQGVIRAEDISPDNTINSQYIADANISYTGKGDVSRQQRQGWLARLLDIIWPF
ncbi:MAG: flagellar basal body L-ring protein FlgH [Pseudomonadota bacterium]